MKRDRRTREQRKADTSARIAFLCFLLLGLCVLLAMTTDAGGAEVTIEEPAAVEKLDGEDIPAEGCAYIELGEFLGEFTLTAYCPCAGCCGKSDGITATGTTATEGRTIAVDPTVILYGSTVTLYYANGDTHSYIAEDCGSGIKANRIDVFFNDHQAALEFGVQSAMAYLEGTE